VNQWSLEGDLSADSAVCVRGALDAVGTAAMDSAFEWSVANPSPAAKRFYPEESGHLRRGHRQPQGGSAFASDDDTAPLYKQSLLPRLPDIQSERDHWDIVSWETHPPGQSLETARPLG
jgi:hypothetical protein